MSASLRYSLKQCSGQMDCFVAVSTKVHDEAKLVAFVARGNANHDPMHRALSVAISGWHACNALILRPMMASMPRCHSPQHRHESNWTHPAFMTAPDAPF